MKKTILSIVALLLLTSSPLPATPKPAYVWNKLADGFLYTTYSFKISDKDISKIHAFRIDPKKFKLDVVTAKDETKGSTAEELASQNDALMVINGGFFTPEHKSIGLLVKDGKQISPLHRTSWWSIFTIKNDRPMIVKPGQFQLTRSTQMALQVGPRIAIDGKTPKLKEGLAIRSAVGITKDKHVVVAITSGHGISMNELALRMKNSIWQGGLECPDAMALDGGSSSQIFAKIGKFEYSQQGFVNVTNGLAVLNKK